MKLFYKKREELLKEIISNGKVMFSINDYQSAWGHYSSAFRAVIKWNSDTEEAALRRKLEELVALYEDGSKADSANTMLIPHILEDKNIAKINIHVNKAHSSKGHHSGKVVVGKVKPAFPFDVEQFEEANEITLEALQLLQAEGYLGHEGIDENMLELRKIYVDVAAVCKMNKCDYIQRRVATGVQVRGDYFGLDEEGFLAKSKLEKIGILLVPSSYPTQVVLSHKRKIRKDALYRNEDDLIKIPLIHGVEESAKLYKRFQ